MSGEKSMSDSNMATNYSCMASEHMHNLIQDCIEHYGGFLYRSSPQCELEGEKCTEACFCEEVEVECDLPLIEVPDENAWYGLRVTCFNSPVEDLTVGASKKVFPVEDLAVGAGRKVFDDGSYVEVFDRSNQTGLDGSYISDIHIQVWVHSPRRYREWFRIWIELPRRSLF